MLSSQCLIEYSSLNIEHWATTCETLHEAEALARIIHEPFCCNRRSAVPTSRRPAGSPLGSSTYCTSTPLDLTAPRAGLTTRLGDFATNRHE